MARITEDHLEQQCLEWFQDIGYNHVFAPQLDSDGSTPERSDYRR
jgi:type I restriction enzyme R subunit